MLVDPPNALLPSLLATGPPIVRMTILFFTQRLGGGGVPDRAI